jgi:predicted transcriptional regulator
MTATTSEIEALRRHVAVLTAVIKYEGHMTTTGS